MLLFKAVTGWVIAFFLLTTIIFYFYEKIVFYGRIGPAVCCMQQGE